MCNADDKKIQDADRITTYPHESNTPSIKDSNDRKYLISLKN